MERNIRKVQNIDFHLPKFVHIARMNVPLAFENNNTTHNSMRKNIVRRGSLIVALASVISWVGCGDKQSYFTVKGNIDGGADSMVYLYQREITGSELVDSAEVEPDGSFEIRSKSPQYPDLYILSLGDKMINLAIDSTETVEVTASANGFATDYKISGSPQSELIKSLYDRQLATSSALSELKKQLENKALSDTVYLQKAVQVVEDFKKYSTDVMMKNLKEVSAYYALFQQIDGFPLFDLTDKKDLKLFSAVATAWDTYRKKSPRAEHLKQFTLNAIGINRANNRTVSEKLPEMNKEADTDGHFALSLPDVNEKQIPLNHLKGRVVLLDFTSYQAESSPAHNIALNKVYEKYNTKGLEIYQVSFGTPIQIWKTVASNLPWICVREQDAQSALFGRFNIQELPTIYIIDRMGNIVKRVEVNTNLDAEIEKVL